MRRRQAFILLAMLVAALAYAATTKLDLYSVQGLLAVANGGTNTATTSQKYVFSGPIVPGTTGAPSFKSPSFMWPYGPLPSASRVYSVMHCDRPALTFCSAWNDEYALQSPGTGGYTEASGTERGYVFQATGTGADGTAYVYLSRLRVRAGKNALVGGTFKFDNSTDHRRCWIGFTTRNLNALTDTPWTMGGSTTWVGCRFSTSIPDSYWTCFVADDIAGVRGSQVTTVAQDTSWHSFMILTDDAGGNTYFWMDDVLIATINAVYAITGTNVGLPTMGIAVHNIDSGVSQQVRTSALYKNFDEW